MQQPNEGVTVYAGQHLSMIELEGWEFVTRNTNKPSVGIVAVTDEGDVVLVEQFRPPVGRNVVEIPAGLAGDVAGSEDEDLLTAAQRELLEETGYVARQWIELGSSLSSPGLTDESIALFLARGLKKRAAGGGDEHERITIHEVAFDEVANWLAAKGATVDLKVMAGLYLAQQEMDASNKDASNKDASNKDASNKDA